MSSELHNDPEFKEIWDLAGDYQYKFDNQNDQAFKKFMANNNKPTLKVERNYTKWFSVAAAIVVLLASVVVITQFSKSETLLSSGNNQVANNIQTITLEDGTVITLNNNAKINWELYDKSRKITLIGRAHFEVAKDANRPFTITSNQTQVTVLGTGFDVVGYPNKPTEVIVNHGKVEVASLVNNKKSATSILTKNMKAVVNNNQINVDKNFNAEATSWTTGEIKFNGTAYNDVIAALEEYYQVEIENIPVPNSQIGLIIGNPKFTGKFNKETDAEMACKIVSKALNLNLEIQQH